MFFDKIIQILLEHDPLLIMNQHYREKKKRKITLPNKNN